VVILIRQLADRIYVLYSLNIGARHFSRVKEDHYPDLSRCE
jgi:hypothetical protein